MITAIVNMIGLLALTLTSALYQPVALAAGLSPEEAADLAYMREEEKLAHDVYTALYDQWGLSVFDNIAHAEATHSAAVLNMLTRYGLDDPAAGNPAGVFEDPELQALYDQLVSQGSASLADALYVGATIEEVDIIDLQQSIAQSERADIQAMYGNLRRGSENHLRAFVGQWENVTGETYSPQYLEPADYAAIIAGQAGNGRGHGRRGRRGSGGGFGGNW